jgi:hypothetical protein
VKPISNSTILRDMPKPLADLTVPKADEVRVASCPQDIVLQTPVTPVSAEAFMSLQNLIIKQDAHALDETSKQSLQRHVQKLTKGAQRCLVMGALKDDQIQFLNTINNEAKVRRSTKALVLGTAKVMSYGDLEAAREKRAEKDAAKEAKGKGKRGWKCKSATLEADEATADKAKRGRKRKKAVPEADAPKPKVKVARISNVPESARGSVVQMSGTPVAEDELVPEPWRALVAQMY